MNLLKNALVLFAAILLVSSCSKEEFSANKNKDTSSVSQVQQYSSTLCSNSTLIKPPVDFLFLWDNSGSQYFINSATKAALWNTINNISSRFDYHILMAPLIPSNSYDVGSMENASLIISSPDNISQSALTYAASFDAAFARLQTSGGGSREPGMDRAIALLKNNQTNGIFRKKAYTMVVMISNGDDLTFNPSGDQIDPFLRESFITQKKNELVAIRDSQLQSLMFRFMSMVPHNYCKSVAGNNEANYVYKKVSELVYNTNYTNGMSKPTDQTGRSTPDSYDICTTDYSHLFDGINGAIQEVVLKHKYDYWPVVSASTNSIDPGKITVRKNTGAEIPESAVDGFEWVGYKTAQNTRYEPTTGEPYTGYLIKLNGTARVTYPECLIIETKAPVEYYGYIQLSSVPMTGTIKVEINGQTIPESTTNGWKALGYVTSQNMKVVSPTNLSPASPALLKSGYMLKLYGNAVYSNGSTVKVTYDPQANH